MWGQMQITPNFQKYSLMVKQNVFDQTVKFSQ